MISSKRKGYVEITQDGIGKLLLETTPKDIEGLYTTGLESCIAVVIVGKKGIILIHDTGQLSLESIKKEFESLGEIGFWTIGYNPQYEREACNKLPRFLAVDFMCQKFDRDPRKTEGGFLSISRNGELNVSKKPTIIDHPYLSGEKLSIRHRINIVNNFFLMSEQGEEVELDIQYNGFNFPHDLPVLKKTPEQIQEVIRKTQNPAKKAFIPELLIQYNIFHELFSERGTSIKSVEMPVETINNEQPVFSEPLNKNNTSKEKLIKKYELKSDSDSELERGLRKAACNNRPEDLKIFITLVQNVNAKDDKLGKTALHWAASKNALVCIRALLDHGADPCVEDKKGEKALDETTNQEVLKLLTSKKVKVVPTT